MEQQQKAEEKPKNDENLDKFPPAWAWIFIITCIAIPIVAVGGALPTGIGVGGAAGCYQVARDKSKSLQTRVLSCVGLTVGAWILFGILVLVVTAVI